MIEPSAEFGSLITTVTNWLGDRRLGHALKAELDVAFPAEGETFRRLAAECRLGVEAGWLATRGDEPLKWGRVIKPTDATQNYSVDVVRMTDVVGPHHAHPRGEIDMIIPLSPDARFDGHEKGWVVYTPGSAHRPTVTGGSAIVVYFLPQGSIDFAV